MLGVCMSEILINHRNAAERKESETYSTGIIIFFWGEAE